MSRYRLLERNNGIYDMKTRYTCVGELASLNSLNVAGASSLDVRQVGRTAKLSNVESFTT